MKNLLITCTLLCLYANAKAQNPNLVPNGNFEQYNVCPQKITTIPQDFSNSCNGWYSFTKSTPDYYNTCNTQPNTAGVPANGFGSQAALTGNGYIGIVAHFVAVTDTWREYPCTNTQTLKKGAVYEISMSVSLSDRCKYASDGLGVLFYSNLLPDTTTTGRLPYTPQVSFASSGSITDTVGWTRLSGSFTADSAYNHLMIGTFMDRTAMTITNLSTGYLSETYYYIDSVVLKRVGGMDVSAADTAICAGEQAQASVAANPDYAAGNVFTVQLSDATGSFATAVNIGSVTGKTGGGITCTIPTNTVSGNYKVRIVSTEPADTVMISNATWHITDLAHAPCAPTSVNGVLKDKINIHPNPVKDRLIVEAAQGADVRLYDKTGRLSIARSVNSDHETIDVSQLPAGLYYLKLTDAKGGQLNKKIVKE